MWKPDDSLDEYIVPPAKGISSEPPRAVSLRRTGELEVLKPLSHLESRAKPVENPFPAFRPEQPLWFRRFLAVGSGALVMIALVLVSAILVGINDRAAEPDLAANGTSDYKPTQPEELFTLEVSSPTPFELTTVGDDIVHSNTRRSRARSRVRLASRKPRRELRPPLQAEQPEFVPTTLVIYAENGVINTRVEPWLQTDDKKTSTFNN